MYFIYARLKQVLRFFNLLDFFHICSAETMSLSYNGKLTFELLHRVYLTFSFAKNKSRKLFFPHPPFSIFRLILSGLFEPTLIPFHSKRGWWLGGCGGDGWVGVGVVVGWVWWWLGWKGGCGVKQSLSNEIALIETVSANRNAPWRNITGKNLLKFFSIFLCHHVWWPIVRASLTNRKASLAKIVQWECCVSQ